MKKLTEEELRELIHKNSAESVYVDFKLQWHENNIKLIHDILCLGNADYNGDRFLLFGVNDQAELCGVSGTNRKTDHKLQDLINKSHFNTGPDISLYTLCIDQKEIDIIQIANTQYKPYFLLKTKRINDIKDKESNIKIPAGVIYTRNGSSNTAIDSTANERQIEKMWKERFGIDESPAQRIKKYLLDVEHWKNLDTGSSRYDAFYDIFPEFTIKGNDKKHGTGFYDQEWTRGEIGYKKCNSTTFGNLLYYHQTCLHIVHLILFDDDKKTVVEPLRENVNGGYFFYYLKDSIDYIYHKHMIMRNKTDDSKGLTVAVSLPLKTNFITYDIPILNNKKELEEFLSWGQAKRGVPLIRDNKDLQNQIWYELLEKYQEWKTAKGISNFDRKIY